MRAKISIPFCIHSWLFIIFSTVVCTPLLAQDSSWTRPVTTSSLQDYRNQVAADPAKRMIELKTLIPALLYDLRYATASNFMKRPMYPSRTRHTFLRQPAALALQEVDAALRGKGWTLKIFDAYRPFAVTVRFWELVHDERYVANPSRGSGHNRGIAVDLTIVDRKTGKELDMGTGFDNFTDTAHQSFTGLPATILENRKILRTVMEQHGFKALETEWWHFYWADGDRYELLDLPFADLEKKL